MGRAEIQQFFDGFDNAFATWTHVEKSRFVSGSKGVWEGVAQGNDKKSGKPVSIPIVFCLDFDGDGKMKKNRVDVDVHLIGVQLK